MGAQRSADSKMPGTMVHDSSYDSMPHSLTNAEIEALEHELSTRTIDSRHDSHLHRSADLRSLKLRWESVIEDRDVLAKDASISTKSSIVMRVGRLVLSSGASGYRVEKVMGHVAALLGTSCQAEVGLVSIDLTITDGHAAFTEVASLPATGVNTERMQILERVVDELEEGLGELTVSDVHRLLDTIEKHPGRYSPWQQGLAAGLACCAFVFLLGGGLIEMFGALVGAGIGNFVRCLMLKRRINQFGSAALSVAVAGLCYAATLALLSLVIPNAMHHAAGYIGAMLFVIPGFPLITSGLDIAKFRFASGLQRLAYALTIVIGATIVGWMIAKLVALQPDEFAPLGLDPGVECLLRVVASFVGVFGFSVMFNSPPRMCLAAALIGAVSNTARLELIDFAGMPPEAAALLGALISGLLASVIGLRFTLPRISLTVPSIVIMVPGLYLYRAMYYLGDLSAMAALSWGMEAFIIILCLPIGLAIARMLTDKNWRYDR